MIVYLSIIFLWVLFFFSNIEFKKNREFSKKNVNFMKLMCAIFIIIHHISYRLSDFWDCMFIVKYLAFPVVGLFFFFSGYGIELSFQKKYSIKNVIKKIYQIVIPFLLITFVFFLINILKGDLFNVNSIFNYIKLKSIPEYWFIYIYILNIILYSFIYKNIYKYRVFALMTLYIFYILLSSYLNFASQWCASVFGFWFGIVYYNYKNNIDEKVKNKLLMLIFCFWFQVSFI